MLQHRLHQHFEVQRFDDHVGHAGSQAFAALVGHGVRGLPNHNQVRCSALICCVAS